MAMIAGTLSFVGAIFIIWGGPTPKQKSHLLDAREKEIVQVFRYVITC
jgi:hypothetical protein